MIFYSFSACTLRTQMWINVITVKDKCFKATTSKSYNHFHPFSRVPLQAQMPPLLTLKEVLQNICQMFYIPNTKLTWSEGVNLDVFSQKQHRLSRGISSSFPITHFPGKCLNIFKNCPLGLNGPVYTYSQTRTAHYNSLPLLCNIQNNMVQTLSPNPTEV